MSENTVGSAVKRQALHVAGAAPQLVTSRTIIRKLPDVGDILRARCLTGSAVTHLSTMGMTIVKGR